MTDNKTDEQKNYEFVQGLAKLAETIEYGYIELGEGLKRCRDEELFRPMYDSLWEMCDEILKISETKAKKLIYIVEKFGCIPKEKLRQARWSVIAEVLPVVKTKADAKRWVQKVTDTDMRRVDLRKEVREAKSGIKMTKCKHTDTYRLIVCRLCGDRWSENNKKT